MAQSQSWTWIVVSALTIFCAAAVWVTIDGRTNAVSPPHSTADLVKCGSARIGSTIDVPSGVLLMGSQRHYPEEAPLFETEIAAFDIDAYEVTNEQFAAFVEATGYVTSAERATELGFAVNGSAVFKATRWSFEPGANWRHPEGAGSDLSGRAHHPVVHISLDDANAFAAWRGRRLPTEAEFEFAARGGLVGADYVWGDVLEPNGRYMANYWQGAFPISDTAEDGHSGTAPVGCFEPNGYGVYDLVGNVWEWTSDPYFPSHQFDSSADKSARSAGFDPRQPDVPVGVIKGGSFLCAQNFCRRFRPAARHAQDIGLSTNHIGFRTASDAPARP